MADMTALDVSGDGYMKELGDIANKLQLPLAQTDDLVQSVANDILRSMWRYPEFKKSDKGLDEEIPLSKEDEQFNARIDSVHRDWNDGVAFPSYRRKKIRGVGLAGSPGHGKTTTIEVAAKRVATAMGMRYLSPDRLESVPLEEIDGNSFAFVSEETAGLVSAMEMFGMPAEGRSGDTRFLARLFSLPLQKLMKAGGGVLLFDDFSNAIKQIQDTGLSLMDRRRNGELVLTKTYFAATGNLGGLDDTNATRMSSALRGRMRTYLVHDTVENFLARNLTDPLLQDSLSDVFVRPFFMRTKDRYFSKIPKKGEQGGYPSPRTWRDAIDDMRDCLHRHGGRSGIESARPELNSILQASVGLETAGAFNTFLEAVLVGAEPLASQLIETGKLDQDKLSKSFSQEGFRANDMFFAHQFVLALADHAINKIMRDGSLDESIARFAKGLEVVKTQGMTFELGLEELQTRLLAQVAESKVLKGSGKGTLKISNVVNQEQGRRELTVEAGQLIGELLMDAIPVDKTMRDTIVRVFSDMNKMDDRVDMPAPRSR